MQMTMNFMLTVRKLAAYKFGKSAITTMCISKDKEYLAIGNELG